MKQTWVIQLWTLLQDGVLDSWQRWMHELLGRPASLMLFQSIGKDCCTPPML